MPYIICINQPGCLPDPYAVATIEEARASVREEVAHTCDDASDEWLDALAAELAESGGTVGPLPDGYVIDVRRVAWHELAKLAGITDWPTHTGTILDAYNNQQQVTGFKDRGAEPYTPDPYDYPPEMED